MEGGRGSDGGRERDCHIVLVRERGREIGREG